MASVADSIPIQSKQYITGQQSCRFGRAVDYDSGDHCRCFLLKTSAASEAVAQRHGQDFDTQVRLLAGSLEVPQELSHDPAGNGKTEATTHHRVDSNHPSAGISQRATGIAGIQPDVRLYHFDAMELCPAPTAVSGGSLLLRRLQRDVFVGGSARGNDAKRERTLTPIRTPNRDHELSYSKDGRIADLGGAQSIGPYP